MLPNNNGRMHDDPVKEPILVFNTSFFDLSQTFIYQQVDILSKRYAVELLGMKFMDPHGYDLSRFKCHRIRRTESFLNRVLNRVFNRLFGFRFFSFKGYMILRKLLRTGRIKTIHAHFGTNALLILPIARWYRVPLVVTFHGADASRMLRSAAYKRRLPGLFRYASAIIIVSRHMIGSLQLNNRMEKVHIIPCAVDTDRFRYTTPETGRNTIRILHAGRLTPKKGVPDLIRAFSVVAGKNPHLTLDIAGDGEDEAICQNLVDQLDLKEQVQLMGPVPHDRMCELMKRTDIFVLNSRVAPDGDMEGTPVSLLEAMAMGKAAISTRHAGIPDVIEHGVNGLLIDEHANDQLIDAMDRLIGDNEFRKKLGNAARERMVKDFSLKVMEKKLLRVFDSLPGL